MSMQCFVYQNSYQFGKLHRNTVRNFDLHTICQPEQWRGHGCQSGGLNSPHRIKGETRGLETDCRWLAPIPADTVFSECVLDTPTISPEHSDRTHLGQSKPTPIRDVLNRPFPILREDTVS